MMRSEIKNGTKVYDTWYMEMGDGIIFDIMKTRFKVKFPKEIITYDYPHARFLGVVKETN